MNEKAIYQRAGPFALKYLVSYEKDMFYKFGRKTQLLFFLSEDNPDWIPYAIMLSTCVSIPLVLMVKEEHNRSDIDGLEGWETTNRQKDVRFSGYALDSSRCCTRQESRCACAVLKSNDQQCRSPARLCALLGSKSVQHFEWALYTLHIDVLFLFSFTDQITLLRMEQFRLLLEDSFCIRYYKAMYC